MCRPERALVQEGGVALHQVGASVQAFLHVSAVVTPPTEMMARSSPISRLSRRSTSRERGFSGAPERPPAPISDLGHIAGQAQAFAGDGGVGDDAVQLQLLGQAATSMSSSTRSGAILTVRVRGGWG